jgi:carbamoyl-phosphate synthase large subunit
MRRFTELKVSQRGHSLVLAIYRLSLGFPVADRYGLLSQLVPTNIAEGSKRTGRHDDARFLTIAEGSLAATEYLLMVSRDLGCITPAQTTVVLNDVPALAKKLHGLGEKVEPPR